MANKEEIEKLKSDWVSDPCWDIEKTEGFEEHEAELLVFSTETKKKWDEYSKQLNAARREINNVDKHDFRQWLIMSIAQGGLNYISGVYNDGNAPINMIPVANDIIALADAIITQLAKEKMNKNVNQ